MELEQKQEKSLFSFVSNIQVHYLRSIKISDFINELIEKKIEIEYKTKKVIIKNFEQYLNFFKKKNHKGLSDNLYEFKLIYKEKSWT